MTGKERMLAALEGRPVDRTPVATPYLELYQLDHFAELTGLPAWERHRWTLMSPEAHLDLYRAMVEATPFDMLRPTYGASRANRAHVRVYLEAGHPVRHDARTGRTEPIAATVSGHDRDYAPNETQRVFSEADADEQIVATPAAQQIADDGNDYLEAVVGAFGQEHFILSGGVIGTLYSSHAYLGMENMLAMLVEQPALVDYVCQKICAANIESIRALAAGGGDAIYIDDALATCDMISVAHYERFSLPYMRAMVEEIHHLGHKAILIYFGGIADRLEQIASLGADGLIMETSMKGYVNDVGEVARRIGDRITLFGNLDPVGILQDGTDDALAAEIARQQAAAAPARGYIASTGSPITPSTPLARVQRFIAVARAAGAPYAQLCRNAHDQ